MPHFREVDAARGWTGRRLGEGASRRRRAGVVRDPIRNLPSSGVLPDIPGGDNGHAAAFVSRNARTVNAGAKTGCGYAVRPGVNVRLLLGQHPSPFFLVQKDYCSLGKAFAPRRGCGNLGIGFAQPTGMGNRFQLRVKPPVEQHEKSEAGRLQCLALPNPGVRLFAGRMVKPEAGIGKCLPQQLQVRVSGIVVAIESQVGGCGRRGRGLWPHVQTEGDYQDRR